MGVSNKHADTVPIEELGLKGLPWLVYARAKVALVYDVLGVLLFANYITVQCSSLHVV